MATPANDNWGEFKQNLKEVYYRFPSPEEMFMYLDSTGLKFDKSVLLPDAKADDYLGTRDQALILGIYIADLGYISLFQRFKESIDYLQTVYRLSDRLRISDAFDRQLVSRTEKNIKNADSLKVISDDALNSIINYLSKNDQDDIFALISLGGFIEFMNISLSSSGEYSNENIIVRKITDQKAVYENILKFSKQYDSNRHISTTLDLFDPLTAYFNKLKSESVKTTVSKSDDGKLIFGGGSKILITGDEFNQLKDIVASIRKKIVTADF